MAVAEDCPDWAEGAEAEETEAVVAPLARVADWAAETAPLQGSAWVRSSIYP